jgi:hypothetical protein
MFLHSAFVKLPLYVNDPLEQIDKAKQRSFKDSGDETKLRKVNYYYEISNRQNSKALSRKLSPKNSTGKAEG